MDIPAIKHGRGWSPRSRLIREDTEVMNLINTEFWDGVRIFDRNYRQNELIARLAAEIIILRKREKRLQRNLKLFEELWNFENLLYTNYPINNDELNVACISGNYERRLLDLLRKKTTELFFKTYEL